MVLALVIGDLHIGQRASDLPARFKSLISPGRVQYILSTGNLSGAKTHDFLKNIAPSAQIVRGEFDEAPSLPERKVVQIGMWKIGLVHGHQIAPWGDVDALTGELRELDCDILITGNTHELAVVESDGRFIINPGSATGAFEGSTPREGHKPSFVLMDISDSKLSLYIYRLGVESSEAPDGYAVSMLQFSKHVEE
ncbi:putative multi-domain containing protein [Aduncisulcus paluster]|uniref:Vacuolar protein sorting-associated protein 29 n=1 Tax=Aduncisulcus paluster TaxID=2918883 RepID=A0ABQ5KWF1_9EUKA|nr:putative multi-domain containing protein [Aduncisulcus paluster]